MAETGDDTSIWRGLIDEREFVAALDAWGSFVTGLVEGDVAPLRSAAS
jgi:hypothetical protein